MNPREWLWKAKYLAVRSMCDRGFAHARPVLLQRHLRDFDVTLCIDVGANRGQSSHSFRRLGYRGDVIAFEPVPANLRELRARFGSDARWSVQPMGLGDASAMLPLHITQDTVYSSFLEPSPAGVAAHPVAQVVETVTAEVRRLDDVLPEIRPEWRADRIHLKIDTQGNDMAVLDGASGILPAVCSLQIELNMEDLYDGQTDYVGDLERLRAMGFALSGMFQGGVDRGHRLTWVDALFVRH